MRRTGYRKFKIYGYDKKNCKHKRAYQTAFNGKYCPDCEKNIK